MSEDRQTGIFGVQATRELVSERKNTHGEWRKQAACAQAIKGVITSYNDGLSASQVEALEMIAVKMSRILCGDPSHADHWADMAGYARLGARGHE